MNYQHSYHAGGFADVFKHWMLTLLLEKLQQKLTPFGVLDTHAGSGFYDLMNDKSQKTLEYEGGIGKLIKANDVPAAFQTYLQLIQNANIGHDGSRTVSAAKLASSPSSTNFRDDNRKEQVNFQDSNREKNAALGSNNERLATLRYYPGSPYIIQQYLREQDSFIACELHAETYRWLKRNLDRDARIALHQQDAYQAMKAFLPLKEKRGLVLIDPPFEVDNEFKQITNTLKIALHRFQHGIYAIWYPIKHRPPVRAFHQQLEKLAPGKVLIAEVLQRDDNDASKLNGNGMAIINPPWQLQETLTANMSWLANYFALDDDARAEIKLL